MAQVIPFPAHSDIATAIQSDKTNLTNLGSQIQQLVQSFNQLHQQLLADRSTTKAQLLALLAQRRNAIEALWQAHRNAIAVLRQKATENNIAIDAQLPTVTLQGLGQLVNTSTIQDEIAKEQSKLTALQNYYASYQSAVAAGQQPPPLPAELEAGAFGVSGTTLALLVGLGVGAILLFKGK